MGQESNGEKAQFLDRAFKAAVELSKNQDAIEHDGQGELKTFFGSVPVFETCIIKRIVCFRD